MRTPNAAPKSVACSVDWRVCVCALVIITTTVRCNLNTKCANNNKLWAGGRQDVPPPPAN